MFFKHNSHLNRITNPNNWTIALTTEGDGLSHASELRSVMHREQSLVKKYISRFMNEIFLTS